MPETPDSMPRTLAASRAPLLINIIGQAYRDLDIIHQNQPISNELAELGLDHLREVIENINADPNYAPAAEVKTFDLSGVRLAENPRDGFYIPWGPEVEEGMGFNTYPPNQVLSMRGTSGRLYTELGPNQYTAYEVNDSFAFGYFIERSWPTYKLFFPGGLHDSVMRTVARYPILVPSTVEEAFEVERADPFMLNLPPGYNTLIRCRLAKSLAPSYGRGFPFILEQLMAEAEENIKARDFHRTAQVSDYAGVGDGPDDHRYEHATDDMFHRGPLGAW